MLSVGEVLQRIDEIRQIIHALREGLQRNQQRRICPAFVLPYGGRGSGCDLQNSVGGHMSLAGGLCARLADIPLLQIYLLLYKWLNRANQRRSYYYESSACWL